MADSSTHWVLWPFLEQKITERTDVLMQTNQALQREIAERRQVEEHIVALSLRNKLLLETTSDGIHVLDEEGHEGEDEARAEEADENADPDEGEVETPAGKEFVIRGVRDRGRCSRLRYAPAAAHARRSLSGRDVQALTYVLSWQCEQVYAPALGLCVWMGSIRLIDTKRSARGGYRGARHSRGGGHRG